MPGSSGVFAAVVGPSGAGKDSLISFARSELADDPRFVFVRRVVTRRSDAALEDHDSLPPEEFDRRAQAGGFALFWRAHDLSYGLPACIHQDLAKGRIVVANLSRKSIGEARAAFPECRILSVTAPVEVLRARLMARGRESAADVEARLKRPQVPLAGPDVTEIENAGALADAGGRFVEALLRLAGEGRDTPRVPAGHLLRP